MSKIDSLTYEKAIEIFRYDAETGSLERKLNNGKWRVCGHEPTCNGYGRVGIDGKKYSTHRLIWLLVYGEWPENDIDHIDRDRMNNRLENLRAVTRTENNHNHGVHKNNSSGYPGVSLFKRDKKYRAQIRINGKCISLGLYITAEEAFTAHMLAKIQCHPTSPIAQQYLRELTLAG